MKEDYKANSITLLGAVSMGTGVMIGAGIFALTGQVAELAGPLFPLAFLAAAGVTGFSAYSYIKMSNAYPSAGGIAMFLERAYGPSVMTGACALLMALTMVINESLVARTFGTYTLQLFDVERGSVLVPVLGVGLIVLAFFVNISGNRTVGVFSFTMALLKIGGIVAFALAALWAAGMNFEAAQGEQNATSPEGFVAAVALAILAYKGFTTITNSGSEIVDPHRNVGRAIVISIGVCVVIYTLVAFAVGASLSLSSIIRAKDFSLAEAARPAFGEYGLWFTVALAIVATASGLIASVFAVSRMLAMLTDMELIPHRHFGMPGRIQKHTLVYTVVIASLLTVFFDLSRIASLGAIFYLVMDIAVHWGVFRHLRREVQANAGVLLGAIALDAAVLGAFLAMKAQSDPLIIVVSILGVGLVFAFEAMFLRPRREISKEHHRHS
ncbi:MAG: APC family permease [Gammaproteobacteria bacterium]